MGRLAILRHQTPDSGAHLDLLLEREVPIDRCAIAFRLAEGTDPVDASEFMAERIADHRAAYFDYEGPLPAPGAMGGSAGSGIGSVTRLASGRCELHIDTPDLLEVTMEVGGGEARFLAERVSGTGHEGTGDWRFTRC